MPLSYPVLAVEWSPGVVCYCPAEVDTGFNDRMIDFKNGDRIFASTWADDNILFPLKTQIEVAKRHGLKPLYALRATKMLAIDPRQGLQPVVV